MGEDLVLENHPAGWCGTSEGLNYVTENQDQLTVGPALERSAAAGHPDDLRAAIQAAPYAFMGMEPIRPAAVPAWDPGGVRARYTFLRVFACATEKGFAVLPGGLAVTAADVKTLTGDCPEQQQSKDIWVLSDQRGTVQPHGRTSDSSQIQSRQRPAQPGG